MLDPVVPRGLRSRLLAGSLLALGGCAAHADLRPAPLPAGSRYVAMGSSYAAGMGLGPVLADSPKRCGRTASSYPHLLADHLQLHLVDVSCSGAVTTHLLRAWSELPPQMDEVTPETQLVTVTIGGNDVGYVRDLSYGSCGRTDVPRPAAGCPTSKPASQDDWTLLEGNLREIVRQIHRRAPHARVVLVDYLRIIPKHHTCASIPLDPAAVARGRETFERLAKLTALVAREEGALLLPAGALSDGHDGCSPEPWAEGYPAKAAGWHPTAAGHVAIAAALAKALAD